MSCILCGHKHYKKTIYGGYKYLDTKYDILRCAHCNFLFLNPIPEEGLLDKLYKNPDYFNNYYIEGASTLNYLEGIDYIDPKMAENMRILRRFKERGKLLDVGCAGGRFLKMAKAQGYDCFGIEPNSDMAAFVEKELHIPVKNTKIQAGLFKEAEFDIVHLGDILEHLVNLKESFELFTKWLKRDGLLFIEQPLTYNRFLFNFFLKLNMFFSRQRYSSNPPFHLWEFNPRTLKLFLEKNSFSVIYEDVYENKAKPLFVYKKAGLKNRLAYFIKNTSAFISGFPFLKWLKLGDRIVILCKKKKQGILFVHPALGIGGAEKNRLSVLRYFDREKYDITLCCLAEKGALADDFEAMGFSVDCLQKSQRSFNIRATFALYRYIKKNDFSIVHSCLSNTNLHSRIAARLAGIPVIIAEEQSEYERYNPLLKNLLRSVNRYLAAFTDKIIVCSEKTGEVISKDDGIPGDKLLVLHNVIDPQEFRVSRPRQEILASLGLDDDDIVIGYVASLARRKGHIYLLEVVELLSRSYENLKLVLVGDGSLREELKFQVEKRKLSGKVIFTGQRRDITDILSILKVFVSPALNEAFGIVLIEAMYMGLPCVATKVGGVSEVVVDGITGILVPPADSSALAEAVSKILNNPQMAQEFGEAGRNRVLENFTADVYARRLKDLYEGLLNKNLNC